MEYTFTDGHLFLRRTPEEREPLLQRLRRVEGQVRGLQQMIADDRYCLDAVQLANAAAAALREVASLMLTDHLRAGVECAVEVNDGEEVLRDLQMVLRAALRQ